MLLRSARAPAPRGWVLASAALISGSGERRIHTASSARMPAITMYGVCTLAANWLSRASRCGPSGVDWTCFSITSIPLSTVEPMTSGAMMPATLLQMPIRLMRCAALSIGPSTLM